MSFLLDTDICSAHIKGNRLVGNKMLQYGGRLFLSSATMGELLTWALRRSASPKRLRAVQDIFNDSSLLAVDRGVAWRFGEIRAGLLDRGITCGEMDLLLAATALVHDLTLVTHNTPTLYTFPASAWKTG